MIVDFNNKKVFKFKNRPEHHEELVKSFFLKSKKGFFVDVGANDPKKDSQSYHLEQDGFTGLLIEPLPYCCDKLRKDRTSKVIQLACSNKKNHGKYLSLIDADEHSTLNTDLIARGIHEEKKISVMCSTLDKILEENNVLIEFDFLSVDIEGHEMEMFDGFSIKKWKPKLIILEDHVLDHKKHNYMKKNSYKLIFRTGLNSWYVPCHLNFKLSFSSKIEFFRKYWLAIPMRKLMYKRF